MHIFIAGVMQGARLDEQIHEQDYRHAITSAITRCIPEAQIIDPWALNPNSVDYDDQRARETFFSMTARAAQADVLIAYLPTISMGTAMEMWVAHQSGSYVIAVTPYVHQWAIRFTANEILPDLDTLLAKIEDGSLAAMIHYRADVDAPGDAD